MDESGTAKHREHSHCAPHAGTSDTLRLSLKAHKRCGADATVHCSSQMRTLKLPRPHTKIWQGWDLDPVGLLWESRRIFLTLRSLSSGLTSIPPPLRRILWPYGPTCLCPPASVFLHVPRAFNIHLYRAYLLAKRGHSISGRRKRRENTSWYTYISIYSRWYA